jgi:uncharacterized delta-60 repeat protein
VVIAGASSDDFAVARYEKDGDLDPGFGGDGIVTTAVSAGFDEARAVVALPGGRVLAAGRAFTGSSQDFALVRYTNDGSLDPGFGGDGIVTTAISPGTDEILALARVAGGRVIAVGRSFDGSGFDFAVARYLSDGSLDATFGGGDGIVTTAFGPNDDRAFGATVQPDGRIVAAGHTCTAAGCDFALARYLPDGSLDASFDGDGRVLTAPGAGGGGAFAVDRGPRGRIVAAGLRCIGSDCDFVLTRYRKDGSLDPSFDSDGIARTSFGPGVDEAFDVDVLPGGKTVAAGRSFNGSDYDVALARYRTNGSLDAGFGAGGTVTTAIGPGDDQASALALRANGDAVVAGSTFNGSDLDIAVARYDG